MDPQQRLLLEVGYASLHVTGERLSALRATDVGAFLGIMNTDFSALEAVESVYAATGAAISVAAGRLSFALGTQGPCSSIDTACSSGLAALHVASSAVVAGECGQALTLAVSLMLTPRTHEVYARAGMLSADGRCKTFDARANGYVRSEGACGLVLGDDASNVALLGSQVRSDGKSASLTAPNGLAQARQLVRALAAAGVQALCNVEAHGTGTALGDPTEAGGLERALGAKVPCIGGVKANLGHSEPVAGLAGLVAHVLAAQQRACAANAKLCVLNPLLAAPLRALKAQLPTQSVGIPKQEAAGVSSFGYSGTIAHTVPCHSGQTITHTPRLRSRSRSRSNRCAFPWRDPPHPFIQRCAPSSEGTVVFRSPAAGALHTIVINHVVQGRVIFPGVGYLEMAHSAATGSALSGVFFLKPLAVEAAGLLVECVMGEGRFEVRSGEGGEAPVDAPVHCSGALATSNGCSHVNHASIRVHSRATSTETLYDWFDAVGLQYGPDYRTLMQLWSNTGDAIARLRGRGMRDGAQVHPADLDDALCTSYVIVASGGETRLPFAIDDARLQGARGELWAVRHVDCVLPLVPSCFIFTASYFSLPTSDAQRSTPRTSYILYSTSYILHPISHPHPNSHTYLLPPTSCLLLPISVWTRRLWPTKVRMRCQCALEHFLGYRWHNLTASSRVRFERGRRRSATCTQPNGAR
jgi:3-oxoacyl-(acyl-carrier-protein) synthase